MAPSVRSAALTILALVCLAANSVLCRMALRPDLIDAPTFMNVRFASGALVLSLLALREKRDPRSREGSWRGALWLALYAIAFSFAYLRLAAGAGALILFGVVQLTMLGWGFVHGERLANLELCGLALALAGLVALTLPGLSAPDPIGAGLMAIAGVGWGFYSLHGRRAKNAILANAAHFQRALPFTLLVSLIFLRTAHGSERGFLLALLSGVVASGCGYILWYAALKQLSSAQAGIVQLSVPAIAAAGGVAILLGILITKLKVASWA
jgi:drug/metabolite transporter (DMT)-like permease